MLLDDEESDGDAACTSDTPEDEESIALLGVDARRWGVPALVRRIVSRAAADQKISDVFRVGGSMAQNAISKPEAHRISLNNIIKLLAS